MDLYPDNLRIISNNNGQPNSSGKRTAWVMESALIFSVTEREALEVGKIRLTCSRKVSAMLQLVRFSRSYCKTIKHKKKICSNDFIF